MSAEWPVEIVNTGTELLFGSVVNTHLAYLGQQLFSLGLRVNRLGDGDHANSMLQEGRLDVEMIAHIPREAIHLRDEQLLDALLPIPAECEHFEELRTVGEFRRFATIHKYLRDAQVVLARKIPTGNLLRLETCTFHLFLR